MLLGDSGTGKSHLLIGLGIAACQRGLRVRYTTAAALVNELAEASDERALSRVVARENAPTHEASLSKHVVRDSPLVGVLPPIGGERARRTPDGEAERWCRSVAVHRGGGISLMVRDVVRYRLLRPSLDDRTSTRTAHGPTRDLLPGGRRRPPARSW